MRTGGRTATFTLRDVIAAGVRIGLAELSMQRVADALGVTTAAIYRHVPSRSDLERLVGEAILEELHLVDDPSEPAVAHLVSFAGQLRRFTLERPGTAEYLLRLFPRGPSGVRLLEHQVMALGRRGYDPAAATALSSAIATLAIGATVADQARAALHGSRAAEQAVAAMAGSELLRQAMAGIPPHTPEDFFVFMLTAAAEGLVAQLPPGRPLFDLRTAS
ncbi:TetR/AcrR family transcriptional regulator [Nonomuraea candida]|uniref:TetR/AcrR family transcriptional regulator n=1 Tax=Nonomuraea candida TaxID=359159 RepID=UPI0005BDF2CC|nr:TetR family transcriptional regulator [Nonomuraea candida]